MRSSLKKLSGRLPRAAGIYRRIRSGFRSLNRLPPFNWILFARLRSVRPVSRGFGLQRGHAVDRHYIEQFLHSVSGDIKGRVLEVKGREYAERFGGDRLTSVEVLDLSDKNPAATIVGDLTSAQLLERDAFDCAIVTQTLQFIYDARAAIRSLYDALKPGGVLLVTLPGISQVCIPPAEESDVPFFDCWRLTPHATRILFEETFPREGIVVGSYGNVLAATALLYGLAAEEIGPRLLDADDPEYPVVITVRAVKS
jgi:SAM-dependent methyltransferase